ncbi:MAG: hypothetical protein Q9187_002900 [Circinaria calcarea]
MALKLETCRDDDMDRTFAIISLAFAHEHPYIDAAFPAHDTPAGRISGGKRMLAIKHSDPNTTFLKVTDAGTGEMVAQAKWNVYNGVVPEEIELEGDFWETEDEKEYAQHLFREYLATRRRAIKKSGGNLVYKLLRSTTLYLSHRGSCPVHYELGDADICFYDLALDILTVDPQWQRRGAGRMLVKWGIAVADKMQVESCYSFSSVLLEVFELFHWLDDYHFMASGIGQRRVSRRNDDPGFIGLESRGLCLREMARHFTLLCYYQS